MVELSFVKLSTDECSWTFLLVVNIHLDNGLVPPGKNPLLEPANCDPDLRRQMASVDHNELCYQSYPKDKKNIQASSAILDKFV